MSAPASAANDPCPQCHAGVLEARSARGLEPTYMGTRVRLEADVPVLWCPACNDALVGAEHLDAYDRALDNADACREPPHPQG